MLRFFSLSLLILTALGAGCSTIPQEKKLEKDGLTLMYRPKAFLGSDAEKIQLQHPARVSENAVRNHLLSLRYEEMSLMSKEKPVFSAEEADKISRLIARAFNQLNPNNIVYFEFETPKGRTVGQAFADKGRLHWRFDAIKGRNFSNNPLAGWDIAWRMVPKDGQVYFKADKLFGKKTWENWIMADLDLPEPARATAKSKPAPAVKRPSVKTPDDLPDKETETKPGKKNPELEEKLRFLKQLREKDLIDEEEFKRKRKDLVDQYL